MLEAKHKSVLDEARRRGAGSVEDLELCFSILALTSAIDRDCAARLKPHQLSEGKFVLLTLLQAEPDGLPPNILAERAGVTRATITGLLDGLERDGILTREHRSTDRRSVTVRLSEVGQRLAADLGGTHTAWIVSLMAKLDPQEKTQLATLLKRVWHMTDAGQEVAV